jgi:hypothetical protein
MVLDMVQSCTWAEGIDMLEPVVAELDERIARSRMKLLDQLDSIEKMWDGRNGETAEALELKARVDQFNAICGQPMIRSLALNAAYVSPALAADAESKT